MRKTGYFVDEIQLVITDKYMNYIIEKGKDIGIKTFEDYEEFMHSECGDGAIKAELIDYMIKDDLVYWDYINFNEKIYMILKNK